MSSLPTRAMLSGAIAVLIMSTLSANAAVRKCQPGVTSEIVQGSTELLGKQRALLSWTTKAFKFGAGYASWRLADKKVLGCKKGKTTGEAFSCIAYAVPCTILQNPTQPGQPSPAVPRRRPGTNKRNAPVET
jgi:hypothetical protein